jgi:cyclic pyranopterin monophosphate synthase
MNELNHFDDQGRAQMVDVGGKDPSQRMARAQAIVTMSKNTMQRIVDGEVGKGDVLGVARLAGIMGAKQTSSLIPLCHPLALSSINVDFEQLDVDRLQIVATVKVTGKTGVEMEALTAVSIAGLTIYDMCKAMDREMRIGAIKLVEKTGGKSRARGSDCGE